MFAIAAAVAEAHDADLARALGPALQDGGGGDEVLAGLGLVELGERLARLVLVAGIAAERRQRIGRERHEVVQREAARDVLDVRIQAAVLVHHQHARQLARGRLRPRQVGRAPCPCPAVTRSRATRSGAACRPWRPAAPPRSSGSAHRGASAAVIPPTANFAARSRNPRRSMSPCTYWSKRFSSSWSNSLAVRRSMLVPSDRVRGAWVGVRRCPCRRILRPFHSTRLTYTCPLCTTPARTCRTCRPSCPGPAAATSARGSSTPWSPSSSSRGRRGDPEGGCAPSCA